jgi:hypothetical protein
LWIFLAVLYLTAALSLAVARPSWAADLFLGEEPEVYFAIDKLNALGQLPGFLANTRPSSVSSVRKTVRPSRRKGSSDTFEKELLRWLSAYVAPKDMGRITAVASFSDTRFTPENADGIPVPKGWSGRASIAAREQTTPLVSGQIRFVSYQGEGGDDGNRLLEAAIEVGYPWFAIQAGKISTWYGPGRHGALILTNNAAPYPGVRIHNPEPIFPKGRSSFLGGLQYDLFVARLENSRPIPHSLLSGIRFSVKPSPHMEIGLSRTMHFGGRGEKGGISEWWDAFKGLDQDDPDGNGIYGFDVSALLPFRFQPIQAYLEMAGEDQEDGDVVSLPSKWAYLAGVFLPSIGRNARWDLRVEYAANHVSGNGPSWYVHPASGEGYAHRYRGNLLGHFMGTDAWDFHVEGRYYLHPSAFVNLSFERLLRYGPVWERRSIAAAGMTGWITPSWRGEARVSFDRLSGQGGGTGSTGTDFSAWISLSWHTDALIPADVPDVPVRKFSRKIQQ